MTSSPPASGLPPLPSLPGGEPEAAPRFWRFERLLVLAVVVTNLAAALLAWFSLSESRQRAEELATLSTRNLVQVLDLTLSSVGRTIDVTLRAVVDELERSGQEGRPRQPNEVLALLARYKGWLPETETLRVFDADGRPRRGAQAVAGEDASEAGRDYFKRLAGESHPGMVVSRPYFDRSTGKWVVSFARRLDLPDGRFGGAVAATVSVDFMTEMLARPDLGPRGIAMLRYEDLGLISVHPPLAGVLNEIGNTSISEELRQLLGTGGASGSYYSPRMLDGVEQINSVRRVDGLPFMLVVGARTWEGRAILPIACDPDGSQRHPDVDDPAERDGGPVLQHKGPVIRRPDGGLHGLQPFGVPEEDPAFAMLPVAELHGAGHLLLELRAMCIGKQHGLVREPDAFQILLGDHLSGGRFHGFWKVRA